MKKSKQPVHQPRPTPPPPDTGGLGLGDDYITVHFKVHFVVVILGCIAIILSIIFFFVMQVAP
jgi:hypothetical protein